MYIDVERLMRDIEEEISNPQCTLEDFRQFVERCKSKDCEEYVRATVMAANVCVSYIGNDKKVLQSIYKTIRKAVIKILSFDDKFCQEYIFTGGHIVALFNTPFTSCIDDVLDYAALLNSAITAINYMTKKKYDASVSVNIGIEFGDILRINSHIHVSTAKETFQGSPINNAIIYAGLKLDKENGNIVISENVRRNLKDEYKAFFKTYEDKYLVSKVYNSRATKLIKEKYGQEES